MPAQGIVDLHGQQGEAPLEATPNIYGSVLIHVLDPTGHFSWRQVLFCLLDRLAPDAVEHQLVPHHFVLAELFFYAARG